MSYSAEELMLSCFFDGDSCDARSALGKGKARGAPGQLVVHPRERGEGMPVTGQLRGKGYIRTASSGSALSTRFIPPTNWLENSGQVRRVFVTDPVKLSASRAQLSIWERRERESSTVTKPNSCSGPPDSRNTMFLVRVFSLGKCAYNSLSKMLPMWPLRNFTSFHHPLHGNCYTFNSGQEGKILTTSTGGSENGESRRLTLEQRGREQAGLLAGNFSDGLLCGFTSVFASVLLVAPPRAGLEWPSVNSKAPPTFSFHLALSGALEVLLWQCGLPCLVKTASLSTAGREAFGFLLPSLLPKKAPQAGVPSPPPGTQGQRRAECAQSQQRREDLSWKE